MLFMKLPKRSQLGDCLSISIQLETRTASAVQRERVREREVELWEEVGGRGRRQVSKPPAAS